MLVTQAELARGISPRAPHRTGLKPLDLSGSCHRSKAAAFHLSIEFLPLPVDPSKWRWPAPFAPRALPRFTTTTKQSAPSRRIGTFGLAVDATCAFPLPSPARFSRSAREPSRGSRRLHAGCRSGSLMPSPELFPEDGSTPGSDIA